MKNYLYTILAIGAISLSTSGSAQIFSVGADALTIKASTVFFADSLVLTPSADFTIASVSLSKNATAANTPTQTYIKRVYRFSATTPAFSGTSVINYVEGAELNGIAETELTTNIHNGTLWQAFTSTGDGTNNNVTSTVSNLALNELTLARQSGPLPLSWLSFTATKKSTSVLLQWITTNEQNTKDFTVQFSTEGTKWSNLTTVLRSTASSIEKEYSYMHNAPVKGINYYRILQTDVDARSSLSVVRTVKFAAIGESFYVLGNPVTNGMLQVQVNTATPLALYNADGKLLQQIQANQGLRSISVSNYSKGMYILKGDNNTVKITIK